MKSIFLLLITTLFLSPTLFAHNKNITHVKSKDYTCEQLKNIVWQEGVVHIKGLGSLAVFSQKGDACPAMHCHDSYSCETFESYWPTKDKTFCSAGYSCRRLSGGGR